MDWNKDGKIDLIVGDASGFVTFFMNTGTGGEPVLADSGHIKIGANDIKVGGKAVPCITDWNGDGKKDLLVGQEDGRIALFINESINNIPLFNSVKYVQANGSDLDTSPSLDDRIAPKTADLNNDGLMDLIAGEHNGFIHYFENSGSNENPLFTTSVHLQSGGNDIDVGTYSRLDVVDWNEEGHLDLIVGDEDGFLTLFLNSVITDIEPDIHQALRQFRLEQNYPNPFNPKTNINYELPITNDVILSVYDALGQRIQTLVNRRQETGKYTVTFNASDLPSGVYYVRMKAGYFTSIRKMALIK